MYALSTHVVPSRTSISDASKFLGCAAWSASTLTAKDGSLSAAVCATRSLARTLPDRYSSAVCHVCSSGSRKITPCKSATISSSALPVSRAINGRSTFARSPMDTASASLAVSTCVTGFLRRIVRLLKISALRLSFLSSSNISSEQSK